jgi:hypothetical protein
MGKADKNAVKNDITTERNRSQEQSNQGISQEQNRVNELIPRSDNERSDIYGRYSGMADTGYVTDEDRARLSAASHPSTGSGSGGSSGGSTNPSSGGPAYLNVFHDLMGTSGGWDPTRLSNVTGDANNLRNSRQNYGDVNNSIAGLQDFASRGGMTAEDTARINRPIFEEFEKTGGYTDADKANIRSRSNSSIASTYGAIKDNLDRQNRVSGGFGPGLSAASFKLARQGAQDIGTNARDTEIGINDSVRAGRMNAANTIAANQLALQPIKNNATLSGYSAAGDLGLNREQQINQAIEAAAGIDTRTQDSINNARLSGASGEMQDTLGRMSIGASNSANDAALNAANERFLISERNANRATGNAGLLDTYKAAPSELLANQDLLRGYRSDASNQQQGLIQARTAQGYMPGLGSDIMTGLGIAGKVAGIGSGIAGAFGGYNSPGMYTPSMVNQKNYKQIYNPSDTNGYG